MFVRYATTGAFIWHSKNFAELLKQPATVTNNSLHQPYFCSRREKKRLKFTMKYVPYLSPHNIPEN